MIVYANTVGEKVTFHFSGRSGAFELAESLKFVEDGSTGSVANPFILSALASPPPRWRRVLIRLASRSR